MQDTVTVGVPVYRGERFLEETLSSIQRQTHADFQVIMSVDSPDPACEAICARFLADRRFNLVVQEARLGWVGNLNWLLRHVAGAFWCYHQQDDLMEPQYLEKLIGHARAHPTAALVYSDIIPIGRLSGGPFTAPSVLGASAYGRVMTMLQEHFPAFAFRGLTRAEALRQAGPVLENAVTNFGVDISWLTAIARYGELHRVAEPLYRKRYHDRNTESQWWSLSKADQIRSWAHHCVDMLKVALQVPGSPEQSRLLWSGAVARLTAPEAARHFMDVAKLTAADRLDLLRQFMDLAERSMPAEIPLRLDTGWTELRSMTSASFWMPHPEPVAIVAFGPSPVTANASFNVQPNGASAIWLRVDRHPGPGVQISLNGTVLPAELVGDVVTALVPGALTARPGSVPLLLVGPDGSERSNTVLFSIL